ncbi:MAG TPA: hypothetical protein PKC55_07910 [Dysgonomonas sp.]|uniref:hypothetical protein n=1 Tax=unclassified Dysgonomonas TaxID=2630389 RepID=UPI0025BFE32B|nr:MULTISPECIES: hypothetical protein [unclassified Dysgonomonas]HML64734.1 hypothetical protein [Dysgonomonas sp.]
MRNIFIEAIKESLAGESNSTINSRIAQILPLGKEAIYRRLNGHVNFSLSEAIEVSKALNISLDNLYQKTSIRKASFNIKLINVNDPACNYYDRLSDYVHVFEKMKNSDQSRLRSAYNIMPYSFFIDREVLSKFHLYKWLYLVGAINYKVTFSEYKIPKDILNIQRRFREENQCVKVASFILARDLFKNFAEDIALFYELELIRTEEKAILKRDLLGILKTIEDTAKAGKYTTGREVYIYLANIHFDASYTHFESDNFEMAHFRVFSINGIESSNPAICNQTKVWIDSLQNYSTLITKSDSVHRTLYFEEQRAIIEQVLE